MLKGSQQQETVVERRDVSLLCENKDRSQQVGVPAQISTNLKLTDMKSMRMLEAGPDLPLLMLRGA